jgi:micrococcal nuclease
MVAVALVGAGCGLGPPGRAGPAGPDTIHDRATVERVIDGDTLDLRIGSVTERVRLIGVDTPESVASHVPDQCFGAEAAAALAEALPTGAQVDISRDVEARDRYGRLLLYLHRTDDGLFVNHWLVAAGLAAAVSYEPNTTHRVALAEAERQAALAEVGLWGACDGPDQPLDPN